MRKYLIKRLAYFIPGLFIMALSIFFLSRSFPNDPVADYLYTELGSSSTLYTYNKYREQYQQVSENLGLDKPLFYFSIHPHKVPDTLHNFVILEERRHAKKLAYRYADWEKTNHYLGVLLELKKQFFSDQFAHEKEIRQGLSNLSDEVSEQKIKQTIFFLRTQDQDELYNFVKLEKAALDMLQAGSGLKTWFPKLCWNGRNTQFHHWFVKLFQFNFGISIRDGRLAKAKIIEALSWTIWINLISSLLAFGLSILIGSYFALFEHKKRVKVLSGILYLFYAIPVFWLATVLIVFFTTSTYGEWTNLFPSIASFLVIEDGNVLATFFRRIGYFILPIFCLLMPSLAFLSKQMKESVKKENRKHYAVMMRLRGFSEKLLFRKHVLKNAIFPMITILGTIIPFVFSGSLIIEVIFNIPGMGRLLYTSILAQDWNIVFAMLLLSALITMIAYLIVDFLYALINPKVKYNAQD